MSSVMRCVALLGFPMLFSGALASELAGCQAELTGAARFIDDRQVEQAERILSDVQHECRGSGYWWLLRGFTEMLHGRDGQTYWSASRALYAPSHEEFVVGELEEAIKGTAHNAWDSLSLFSFPIYTCSFDLDSPVLAPIRTQFADVMARKGEAQRAAFAKHDWVSIVGATAVAVADYARQSLTHEAPKGMSAEASKFEAAVDQINGASGPAALAKLYHSKSSDESKVHSTGMYLRGLLLVDGIDHLCFRSPRPDSLRTFKYGPSGEPNQANVPAGTMLLFHRSLKPRQCAVTSKREESGDTPRWMTFKVWLRPPQTPTDARNIYDGLKFFGTHHFPEHYMRALLQAWSNGGVNELWPWHSQTVRYHYDRHVPRLLQAALANRAADDQPRGHDELQAPCPDARTGILELESLAELKLKLLIASAKFLSKHLQQDFHASDLEFKSSVLCQVPHTFPRLLMQGGTSSGAMVRVMYLTSLEDFAPDPLPLKVWINPQAFEIGGYSSTMEHLLKWPFKVIQILAHQLPQGSALLFASSSKAAVIPGQMTPNSTRKSSFPSLSATDNIANTTSFVVVADVGQKQDIPEVSCSLQPLAAAKGSQLEPMADVEGVDNATGNTHGIDHDIESNAGLEDGESATGNGTGEGHAAESTAAFDSGDETATELFPTKIYMRRLSDAKQLNSQVKKFVLKASKKDDGKVISNAGGWHAGPDFLTKSKAKCMEEVVREIKDAVRASLLGEIPAAVVANLNVTVWGWANVNYQENYNVLHQHAGMDFQMAGTYLVDTGDGVNSTTRFSDPRPVGSHGAVWRALEPEPYPEIRGTGGLITIFPSWIDHFVLPHNGSRPRITLAFNARATWKKDSNQEFIEKVSSYSERGVSSISGRPYRQKVVSAWHSTVVHRWSAKVVDLGPSVWQRHARSGKRQQGLLVCDSAMFDGAQRLCRHPVEDLKVCGEVLSTARSALCRVSQQDCNASFPWNLQARSRGAAQAAADGASAASGLAAAGKHQPDALLWVVAVLRVNSGDEDGEDGEDGNGTAKVRFKDPRTVSLNLENLWASHNHRKSEVLLRPGVVVAYPPWLQTEIIPASEKPSWNTDLTVDLLGFDVYATKA